MDQLADALVILDFADDNCMPNSKPFVKARLNVLKVLHDLDCPVESKATLAMKAQAEALLARRAALMEECLKPPPLADRLDDAMAKLAGDDGAAITALLSGPDYAAVVELPFEGDPMGSQWCKNIAFGLYFITLKRDSPAALGALRLVVSKREGLSKATGPCVNDIFPVYCLFFTLLPDIYPMLSGALQLVQSPVPGLEVMLAAGADPNFKLTETGMPWGGSPYAGETPLMALAHFATNKSPEEGGTIRGWVVDAAKALVKHGANKGVQSTSSAEPDRLGKTLADFAPDWFKEAVA